MSQNTVNNWISMVSKFIREKDVNKLNQFIDIFKNKPNKEIISKEMENYNDQAFDIVIKNKIEEGWQEIVFYLLKSIQEYYKENISTAFEIQKEMMNYLSKLLKNEDNWLLPLVYTLCLNFKELSVKSDKAENKNNTVYVKDATMIIHNILKAIQDRENNVEKSKKLGSLMIANIMFSLYFMIASYRLCIPIIRMIESSVRYDLSVYPIPHQITYR
eukprot:TRINITY_DN15396_c0_g1_i1.p1 TRINITY_DN15396_c0_g1~~TRINITY_DN15396_c0_g1_i1.p1  ORF type:complete len:216 (+),score=36.26 TRINITY_DN15396_c0_g1_i1:2-649(+)